MMLIGMVYSVIMALILLAMVVLAIVVRAVMWAKKKLV